MESGLQVIVVARDGAFVDALRASLGTVDGITVAGPCSRTDEVAKLAAARDDSVALVDLVPLDRQALDLVTDLRDLAGVPVLVVGSPAGSEALSRALTAGACGVVPPLDDPDAVVTALRRAVSGELVLPVSDLSAIVDALRPPVDRLDVLTRRERQTLHLLAEGFTTSEVALHLGITAATVQTHVKNVLAKLGVHSKVQAVRVALLSGA